ncbi:MAG: hypothetical protein SNJ63_04640 [Sphingomonadaceae bacterium]
MQESALESLLHPPVPEALVIVAFVAVLVALRRALGASRQRRSS